MRRTLSLHRIYIPTFRRVDQQITFEGLPDKYKEKTILVVQEQERHLHKHDVEYLVVGNDIGIAKTRYEIIKHAGKKRFSMYDDDCNFKRRNAKYFGLPSDMEGSKRTMTAEDFDDMYEWFNDWMDNDNVIQASNRSSNLPPEGVLYKELTDCYGVNMLDGEKIQTFFDEVDWTYVKVGEDSLYALEFLTRGFKNRRTDLYACEFRWWQEGGCSTFRDAEFHNKEHEKLLNKFPEFVYLKGYEEREGVGRIKEYKYRWKDAYKSSHTRTLDEFYD